MPEKEKKPPLAHWKAGKDSLKKCNFSSDTLEGDMFSVNVLGHRLFIHWHPLALPGLLMAIRGVTHLPQIVV